MGLFIRSLALGVVVLVLGLAAVATAHHYNQRNRRTRKPTRAPTKTFFAETKERKPARRALSPPSAPAPQDLEIRLRPGGLPCHPDHPGIAKPCNPAGAHDAPSQHWHHYLVAQGQEERKAYGE